MKITKDLLREMVAEEVQQVLYEESELGKIYGAIMNLLMGRGQWENAGGTEQGRKEAYDILLPHLSKMMKIVMAQQKKK